VGGFGGGLPALTCTVLVVVSLTVLFAGGATHETTFQSLGAPTLSAP